MKKTILICDDDVGILDLLEFMFEEHGFTLIREKNSLNIFDIVKETPPDLLLLDLWMPILSGDQIVRTLKTNPQTKDIPVIIISASTEGKEIAKRVGADEFVAKPFDVDLLVSKVEELIQRKHLD